VAPSSLSEPVRRDRRHARHEATKREILDAAWRMVGLEGLNGWSMRALARSVDMEPQSLYTYFSSKHAVYDHLFADGNRQLLTKIGGIAPDRGRSQVLRDLALLFLGFAAEDPARYELLFLRTIPDFEPSPESYEIAVAVFAAGRSLLQGVGLESSRQFDLWTALVAGLVGQQVANDPGGRRYVDLVDDAVAMFTAYGLAVTPRPSPHRDLLTGDLTVTP
jgi:AcrR family transcriptional regulator